MKKINIKASACYFSFVYYFSLFLSNISFVNAQTLFGNLDNLFQSATDLVSGSFTNLLMGLAFAAFVLSVIGYIFARAKGDAKGFEDSKGRLMWTTFALFIMVAVWGIVNFIEVSFLGDKKVRNIERPQTSWNSSVKKASDTSSTSIKVDIGALKEGEMCERLAGSSSQCQRGMTCITSNNKVGEIGQCVSSSTDNTKSGSVPYGGSCKILPGSQSQCVSGYICRSRDNTVGSYGQCAFKS